VALSGNPTLSLEVARRLAQGLRCDEKGGVLIHLFDKERRNTYVVNVEFDLSGKDLEGESYFFPLPSIAEGSRYV